MVKAPTKSPLRRFTSRALRVLTEISRHPEIEVVAEKIDDGYSGVLFDRPAFQEMMQMIEQGEANCVIVKDLSRLGREYIETGRYMRRVFPAYVIIDQAPLVSNAVTFNCFIIRIRKTDVLNRFVNLQKKHSFRCTEKSPQFKKCGYAIFNSFSDSYSTMLLRKSQPLS